MARPPKEDLSEKILQAIKDAYELKIRQIEENNIVIAEFREFLQSMVALKDLHGDLASKSFPKVSKFLSMAISHVDQCIQSTKRDFDRYEQEYGVLDDGSVVLSYTDLAFLVDVSSVSAKKYVEKLVFEGKLIRQPAWNFFAYKVAE